MLKHFYTAAAVVLSFSNFARAQLAITEAMSSASTNLGATLVSQNSDWWELTNFGTNALDLTGYSWNDKGGGFVAANTVPFMGFTIGRGEWIVFFQSNSPASMSPDQFRAWWNIPVTVQAVIFQANGLGSTGDGIRIWGPSATSDADALDSVDFLDALRGSTFTYNPSNGLFGWISTNGVGGAFKAATAEDVGSPGVTSGPVPTVILTQPTNLTVNAGDTAQFKVVASGMPKPRYQWLFRGAPVNGARSATLTITDVQTSKLGAYSVIVDNGVQSLVSSNAVLALNPTPEPPTFVVSPSSQSVFVGQSLTFVSLASGTPQPSYRWLTNGVPIPGATVSSYSIPSASLGDAGTYTIIASNRLGQATNEATLAVTPRPHLVITEIMAAESTNGSFGGHNDWFELSNFDDFTVDLTGYRLDDSSSTLAAAGTLTHPFSHPSPA